MSELESLSRQIKIPLRALKQMVKAGLIGDPPSPEEINNLAFLSHFWGKPGWLRMQITKLSIKNRLALVLPAEMDKVSSYIFNRYLNAEDRLYVRQVADEVQHYYGVPVDEHLIRKIYRLRAKARRARRRLRQLKASDENGLPKVPKGVPQTHSEAL